MVAISVVFELFLVATNIMDTPRESFDSWLTVKNSQSVRFGWHYRGRDLKRQAVFFKCVTDGVCSFETGTKFYHTAPCLTFFSPPDRFTYIGLQAVHML